MELEPPEERMFRRQLCPIDRAVASFKIEDSRICIPCYLSVKKISHLELEQIEALTLAGVKKILDKKPEPDILQGKETEHETRD
jgi:hypothetical protein